MRPAFVLLILFVTLVFDTSVLSSSSHNEIVHGVAAMNLDLLRAVERCDSEVVRECLRSGADPNIHPEDGEDLLCNAIFNQDPDSAMLLIQHGADVNFVNFAGGTPLHMAISQGLEPVAVELVNRGANVELGLDEWASPLLSAITHGYPEMAMLILKRDEIQSNPKHLLYAYVTARNCNQWELENLIGKHLTVIPPDSMAIIDQDLEYIPKDIDDAMNLLDIYFNNDDRDLLLNEDPDSMQIMEIWLRGMFVRNAFGLWGNSRLSQFFEKRGISHPDNMSGIIMDAYVYHLKGQPIDLDQMIRGCLKENEAYYPPFGELMNAIKSANRPTLKKLLKKNPDLEARRFDPDCWTPLTLAAHLGHIEMVTLLLDAGADINQVEWANRTALSFAAEGGHADVVRVLLKRGANPMIKTNWGDSPLIYAVRKKQTKIVKLLLHQPPKLKPGDYQELLIEACKSGDAALVQTLVPRYCTPVFTNEEDRSPLAYACLYGHPACVKTLVDMGADLNWQDEDGNGLFYYAYRPDTRKMLLELGCPIPGQEAVLGN